ncbi:MAG: hypothetical protein IJ356_03770 [Erysipelotrichaceae bacterium]|nr:hypothetical protein [Erysipelotrichaceae bacterium]
MFKWMTGNTYSNVVTLYANNFTLNSVACQYFQEIRWCLIGIDEASLKVAIKPVTAREIDLHLAPMEHLNKVSMGKGYARISNKHIVDEISTLIQKECNGLKFLASYDEKEKMLIVDLNRQL